MDIIATTGGPFQVLVPKEYRSHELVAGRVFYTLPPQLLAQLVKQCGRGAFDAGALKMETELAERLAHNKDLVGYSTAGEAISCPLLAREEASRWEPGDEALRTIGLTPDRFDEIWTVARARMAPLQEALRGYGGWLVTNPQFLKERDELLDIWNGMLKTEGIPQSGPTTFGKLEHNDLIRHVTDTKTVKFLKDFECFYARWRLRHLTTRELPEPLAPQTPLLTPLALLTHMRTGGVSVYLPDTMPIPGRDRLLDVLEDIRLSQDNDHLAEWIRISRRSRRSNHAIRMYGQLLVVNHYWTQLQRRHHRLFDRRMGQVQEAFAEYLCVSPDAVDKYRQKIGRRLRSH